MKALLLIAIAIALSGCAVGYSSKDGWFGRVEVKPEDVDRYADKFGTTGYAK